jgi:hypothetical protein
MDFIKKHYEKVILALVLVGLVGAVGFLLIYIPQEQQKLKETQTQLTTRPVTPLVPLDTHREDAALARLQGDFALDLTTDHRVFNPVLWQMYYGGRLRKIVSDMEIGPRALVVTAINPIYSTITYLGTNSVGYQIRLLNPIGRTFAEQRGQTLQVHFDPDPKDRIILKRANGPSDSPTSLDLEVRSTHEDFNLPTDPQQPARQVAGYEADIKYPPDPSVKPWSNARVGTLLRFEGSTNQVLEVGAKSVVVSDKATTQRTTIPLSNSTQ